MQKNLFNLALGLMLASMPTTIFAITDENNNSNSKDVAYINADCDAGAPIYGEVISGGEGVRICWGEEVSDEHCLFYDDGINVDGVGMTNGGSFYWGIKFPAEDLAQYAGYAVTKIAYFDNTAHTGNILIYSGTEQNANRPSELLATIPYTAQGSAQYIEWEIPSVDFDNTRDLWIVMHNDYGMKVASAGAYCGNPNGSLMAAGSGQYWYTMDQIVGSTGTWNLRCYVAHLGKGGETVALENKAATNGTILKYNVYRSTSSTGNYELIGEVEANEGQSFYQFVDTPNPGEYYYQVRADYGDCLSDPAVSAEDPSVDYVHFSLTGINENNDAISIYPNPTKSFVTIEGQGLNHITVINTIGQIVFDSELNLTNNYTLNLSQYKSGVYMVRIYAESGMVVKRISVLQ